MTAKATPIRVLVADDQSLVRAGFRMILEAEPDMRVIAEADDGKEAIRYADQHRPDVVLMDIRMPVLDGIEATRAIRAIDGYRPQVVILTTYDLDEYVYDALAAGASGFLLKDVPPEDLPRAVRVVHSGDALLAPTVTRRLVEQFTHPRPDPHRQAQLAKLTERERDVLIQLARGQSNTEIASELYLGESTVKTHVAHILNKLAVRDRIQAVIYAYEIGLIRPGETGSAASTTATS